MDPHHALPWKDVLWIRCFPIHRHDWENMTLQAFKHFGKVTPGESPSRPMGKV